MGLLLAVLYRYWHLFRRHLSEYLMLWVIPLLFALAVTYLPTVVSSPQQVLARARAVTGLELRSEQELLTYSKGIRVPDEPVYDAASTMPKLDAKDHEESLRYIGKIKGFVI